MGESERVVVGHFEARTEITVEREPELGLVWEANARDLGQGALRATPREAVTSLIKAMSTSRCSTGWSPDAPGPGRERTDG